MKDDFRSIIPPDWDSGYDADHYPSHWRQSNRPSAARLDALGSYDLSDRQEAYTRSQR